jgi:peptidyl-prolyl cis-trans isomerase C
VVLALAFGLPAIAQTPPPAKPAATPSVSPTVVAATVNGEPIYEMAVQRSLERLPPARRAETRPTIINQLADNLLIEQHLIQKGIKVEKADVDKRVSEMREGMKKINKDFDKMLAEFKITEAELRQHIAAETRWYKYVNGQANDKALKTLFDANKDLFDGSAVRARHILIPPTSSDPKAAATIIAQMRQIKKDVLAKTEAGLAKLPANTDKLAREKARGTLIAEAFAAAAKEKSQCPTKSNGGDVGWFQKAGPMVAPFSQAAFALQPNEIGDVVHTPFGYHLILVTERKPGREVKFEDMKELVKEFYAEQQHDKMAGELRLGAKIVINPPPK